MASIYQKLAAGQTAFTAEAQDGDYLIEYPLGPAEPTHIAIKARFKQFRADYARPAANTTLTYGALTAYFIDDVEFSDDRGGLCSWTRLWATIPASWSEPEDYAYTFPAFTGSNTYGTTYAVSSLNTSTGTVIVTNATSTGIAAGDAVYVQVSYTRNSTKITQTWNTLAVATTNNSQTTINGVLLGSGTISAVSGFVAKSVPARAGTLSAVAAGRLAYDYALTSISSLNTDLPLTQPFGAVDSAGIQTTTLSASTTPTSTIYAGYVTSGAEIVVECTRSRYLGNIFCRQTRLVPAM